MASVDDKVVSLEFNNGSFERKVSETLGTLARLKSSLSFSGATKGMDNLSAAAKGFSVSNITQGIESVGHGFIAMSTIAITAISDITSAAINAGTNMVKGFAFEPITQGFHEYETEMTSIQTILANTASKGTTLDEVSASLNDLNTYADKTIYNFSEMARNIGTFTAAGVDLKTSQESIKGIANLAAMSGSSADQAATAMYQLSQAIAAGTVKLQDWNSVVNAGMGGESFKETLFETGKALGTLKGIPIGETFEDWENKGNSFRESLKDGWVTKDVLTQALKLYGGDLSKEQIKMMGYTDKQAEKFYKMGQMAMESATKIKTLTQLMSTIKEAIGSGWAGTFRIIFGNISEAKNLFSRIGNSIGAMVQKNAQSRNLMLDTWKKTGGRLAFFEGIKNALTAIRTFIEPIKDAFREFFPPMTAQRLNELSVKFMLFTKKLIMGESTVMKIWTIFRSFFGGLRLGIDIVKNIAGVISGFFTGVFHKYGSGVLDFLYKYAVRFNQWLNAFSMGKSKMADFGNSFKKAGSGLSEFAGKAGTGLQKAVSSFENFINKLGEVLGKIKDWGSNVIEALQESINLGNFSGFWDALNMGLIGGIALIVRKFMKEGIKLDLGGGIFDKIRGAFDQLTGTLKAMQMQLKAQALMKLAEAIGILTLSVLVLSAIDPVKLTKALTAMAAGFGELAATMAILTKTTANPKAAASLSVVSGGLILLAGAMLILSLAVRSFAKLKGGDLAKGLIGVGVSLDLMSTFAKSLGEKVPGLVTAGVAMIGIAIALNILYFAVKNFSGLGWAEMAKGMAGVATGLGLIVGAMLLLRWSKGSLVQAGLGIIGISIALNILYFAVKNFSGFGWAEMAKGMTGIGVGLGLIVLALNGMKYGEMLSTGAGLLLISIGLNFMARAMKSIGSMKMGELVKSLIGLAVALGILALATYAMSGSIVGAAALTLVSVSLIFLARAMQIMGKVPWMGILKGMAALVGILLIFAVAAALLTASNVVWGMLALGAALLLLGVGIAAIGVGAYLLATAFRVIATAGKEAVGVISLFLDMLIKKIPAFLTALAKGLADMALVFLKAAPALIAAATKVVASLLQSLAKIIPDLFKTLGVLIDNLIKLLYQKAPGLIKLGLFLLIQLLDGISNNIEEITQRVIDIIVKFTVVLAANIQRLLDAGFLLLTMFLDGITKNLDPVATAVNKLLQKFVEETGKGVKQLMKAGTQALVDFLKGLGEESWRIVMAAVSLAIALMNQISTASIILANAGLDCLLNFLRGLHDAIKAHSWELFIAGLGISTAMMEGLIEGFANLGATFLENFWSWFNGLPKLARKILEALSPSRKFMRIGADIVEGLAVGIQRNGSAHESIVAMGDDVVSTLSNTLAQIPSALDQMDEFTPTITPVLDLSNVQNDASKLGQMLGQQSVVAGLSYDQARVISEATRITQEAAGVPVTQSSGPAEVKFEQTINSLQPVSTVDIYRQTKSLIALAKEELNTP